MFYVVTGGSGSGKSAFAEYQIQTWGAGRRIYLATMRCFDEESKKRIERHRLMRSDKDFETLECATGLAAHTFPEDGIVLLECMSNLVANEMFLEHGAGKDTVTAILKGIDGLQKQVRHLCVVTNEVFSDGGKYDEETLRYQQYLGEINHAMAQMADQVIEVVYGLPIYLKREVL